MEQGSSLELIVPKKDIEFVMEFNEIMTLYEAGIKEITTKLEILNNEFKVKNNRNPIESIKSRVKSPQSIYNKLERKGLSVNTKSMLKHIHDIAGIRINCSFISDIYNVANMLTNQDDVHVVKIKDYIKHPKKNGYRSLHLVVTTPVFYSDHKQEVTVEIQIRTIAMDFWASLEHKIRYKKDYKVPNRISKELKECADVISQTDLKMQKIMNEITLNNHLE